MKPAVILCALFLTACSQGDNDRARQDEERAKHDSRVVLNQAEAGAQKASKELNRDLDKTRDKVRQALDEPSDKSDKDGR